MERPNKLQKLGEQRHVIKNEDTTAEDVKLLLDSGTSVDSLVDIYGFPYIYRAVQSDQIDVVKLLLERGAKVNLSNNAPLHRACESGNVEMATLLANHGALVDHQSDRTTALFLASQGGHLAVVDMLLSRGARVNHGRWVPCPVAAAAKNGHIEIVKLLLRKTPSSIAALCEAAKNGHLAIVRLLLDEGASLDTPCEYDMTPIELAAQQGHLEVVKLLIERGASLEGPKSSTPLPYAADGGHIHVVQFLLGCGAKVDRSNNRRYSPLGRASYGGHLEVVKLLLDRRAFVDIVDNNTHTPLGLAAKSGHIEIVKLLLEHGATVELANSLIYSPLCLALQSGHTDVVRVLLEHGAHVNLQDCEGYTPLYLAAQYNNEEVARILLDNNANINATVKSGKTPLAVAAKSGHVRTVKLLLERGAAVDLPDGDRCTPLTIACELRFLEVVKLLLDHGAHANLANKRDTPLGIAARCGDLGLVQLLVEKGASISLPARENYTALAIAAFSGHAEVVKWLLANGARNEICNSSKELFAGLLVTVVNKGFYDAVKILVENGAVLTPTPRFQCLVGCFSKGRLDIVTFLLNAFPQLAKEEPSAIFYALQRNEPQSSSVVQLLIHQGADVNAQLGALSGFNFATPLHMAILSKQVDKVWQLVLHGADTSIPLVVADTTTEVWGLCGDNKEMREALLHFWTPQTHKLHAKIVRDVIVCVLLVAKRNGWPFDQLLMLKLLSHIAFDWPVRQYLLNASAN